MEQPILPFVNQYKKYAQTITPFLQSSSTKNYSTVIFFFLVLSVFGWFAIRPTIQTILYLQREIKDKTEIDKKMDAKIYALIEANAAYENNQSLFPVLSETIPNNPEALDAVSQMKNLAMEKNVLITLLQMANIPLSTPAATQAQKNKKLCTELPVTLSVEGPFLSILSFLKELISLRRIVTIQTMNFVPVKTTSRSASQSAQPTTIKVNITLATYYETK